PGAIGKRGTYEKTVVLLVARELARLVNEQPGMHAYLTRRADYYLPLRKRVEIAIERQADLFISIHADAVERGSPTGASVYALSNRGASSEMARLLANKENAADLAGGFTVSGDEVLSRVLLDLATGDALNESLILGQSVLGQLGRVGRLSRKQVEQAGFVVLKSRDIPAILVETAFISTPSEERKLRDANYRNQLARAILEGIKRYVKEADGRTTRFKKLRRIRALDDRLVNQIAAGEVVERPASIVKELVENSVDAGARRIAVEVERGGLQSIQVEDDGSGIAADELALALTRHATSKIENAEDLHHIASFGFRGEALPSIASVSRMTVFSAVAGERGAQARVEGGSMPEIEPRARQPGTTMIVEDLFFNTPARRKFLRAESTEFAYLATALRRIALANGEIAFSLRHKGRKVFDLPAGSETISEPRMRAILGDDFANAALPVDSEANGMRLQGWVSVPRYSRSQRDQQHLYVNGRAVRDASIAHAVRAAYRDLMYHDRHPAWCLFLTLPADAVDVNVHPTKQEVRFRQQRDVHDFVRHAVSAVVTAPLSSQGSELGGRLPGSGHPGSGEPQPPAGHPGYGHPGGGDRAPWGLASGQG
ncbi:unnamed protein product, partial [Cyprideis torosa]